MAGTNAIAGIGLRPPHLPGLLSGTAARPGWVEIHAETFMPAHPGAGSHPRLRDLERLRADLPVSIHGVGLSPGSAGGIDADHLARLVDLARRLDPVLVSEHAAWCRTPAGWIDDLLPLPMTVGALRSLADNVCRIQDALKRPLLIENPSTYLPLAGEMDEPAFLTALVRQTGCGLLLDVNNIAVSAHNLGGDAHAWLAAMPLAAVGEIHIAGHAVELDPDDPAASALLIDDHGHPVADPVWDLLDQALAATGPVPVLLERDTDLPPWAVLIAEAARADLAIDRVRP